MSTLKTNSVQIGQSNIATANFALSAANADGTAKLARGNVGATTQDIMTVATDGKVDFPAGLSAFLGSNQSLSTNGYQKLPGGLIIQWQTISVPGTTMLSPSFPIAFPNACFAVFAQKSDSVVNGTNYRWDAAIKDRFSFYIGNNWQDAISGYVLSIGY